jgi:deoxyribodipyrimidine photo-lyase
MNNALVWLRRDLRLHDHAALHHALASHAQVWVVFIFDSTILEALIKKDLVHDRRVDFIWQCVQELDSHLRALGGGLMIRYGNPIEHIPNLANQLKIDSVFINRDYEPSAIERDQQVKNKLEKNKVQLHDFKDHVIFEKTEILTNSNTVFSIFTPYKNAWLKKLQPNDIDLFDCDIAKNKKIKGRFVTIPKSLDHDIPSLESMGFKSTGIEHYLPAGSTGAEFFLKDFLKRIDQYNIGRDFPAIKGVSYLSTHLRFGTISIRGLAREAHRRMLSGSLGATTWLNELIWRDFYFMILSNHPRLASGAAFKVDYEKIEWEKGAPAQKLFKAWCDGKTGYPLVDAAMHQLNQSGYMHNRLRMVVASFLTKDLGIDWRRGEDYFAKYLNDFELASNNGGWQWASSSGCDAQPYFRIFNPITQSERFDSEGKFIRRYLPALEKLSNKSIHAPWLASKLELEAAGIILGRDYPLPVVDHDEARKKTLIRYNVVKKN